MKDKLADLRTESFKKTGEYLSDNEILDSMLLLSISEAARLMSVCENTLRDWDTSGKFISERTDGGHRRYSIVNVRKYIDKKETEKTEKLKTWIDPNYGLIEKYKNLLEDVPEQEQKTVAILIENCISSNVTCCANKLFTLEQLAIIVKKAWMKLKFKKMISIQPLSAPNGYCYHYPVKNLAMDIVSAKTQKYNFTVFTKANFENVVDLYAEAIAYEIDLEILKRLPKSSVDFFSKAGACFSDIRSIFDYIIAPKDVLEEIKKLKGFEKVDLYEIDPILDEKLEPIVAAGKYNEGIFKKPIYCPFVLFQAGAALIGNIMHPMLRQAWLE